MSAKVLKQVFIQAVVLEAAVRFIKRSSARLERDKLDYNIPFKVVVIGSAYSCRSSLLQSLKDLRIELVSTIFLKINFRVCSVFVVRMMKPK